MMPDACQCSGPSIRQCRNECRGTHSAERDSQMQPYRLLNPWPCGNSQVAFSCPGCIVQVRAVRLRSIVCPGVFGMSTRPFSKSRSTRARGRRSDSPWSEHIDPATGRGFYDGWATYNDRGTGNHTHRYRWVDGWMDGRTDGWIDI